MKFPTDRPVKVVMLGAGGTGGYVAPYVFRLLHMLDRPTRFIICDGDIVEPKNLDRQNFVPADLGENMIYYALDTLLQAGIQDILIITPPNGEDESFRRLLGDGSDLGIHISYLEQPVARGIADALILGEKFIGTDRVCLVLGDNIFFSPTFGEDLRQAARQENGAWIFGYYVDDPRPFGVVEFDAQGNALSLEEKPTDPKSNYIVPGLYFYDHHACEIARSLTPSARGELEITDVNREYMKRKQLKVTPISKDFIWFDAGTAASLLRASCGVDQLQRETGRYIACVEETAWRMGYITTQQKNVLGEKLHSTLYGQYLLGI